MSFTLSENWDGVTAPAIPSGWVADSALVTSSVQKYTSPNSLLSNSNGNYYAINSSADAGGGQTVDITSTCYIETPPTTGSYFMGPLFRCSSTNMTSGGASCYFVNMHCQNNMSTVDVQFSSLIAGVQTDIASVSCVFGEVVSSHWYLIHVTTPGTNTFDVTVTRASDGWYLNPSGSFQSGAVSVISGLSATTVASGPYYGLAAWADNSSMNIYQDDFTVNATATTIIYPRKPVIARVPFQYYIFD
jgi:hypothetical protein